jgi:hypothetical protein
MGSSNGWDEYKRLVINELERTNSRLSGMDKRLQRIEKNIAILQTKAYMAASAIALVLSGSISLLFRIL